MKEQPKGVLIESNQAHKLTVSCTPLTWNLLGDTVLNRLMFHGFVQFLE